MAITQNTYTGNGSTVLFSFTFPYLETTDIKVSLDGVLTTAYTLANATTVQFNTAPSNGVAIRIFRDTDDAAIQATFFPGSAIRSQDLNDNFTQLSYIAQEVKARTVDASGDTMTGQLNMGGNKITNLGTPTNSTDASTKAYVDSTIGTAGGFAGQASASASAAAGSASAASTSASNSASSASAAASSASAASASQSAAASSQAAAAASQAAAASSASNAASSASNSASSATAAANSAASAASSAASALTAFDNFDDRYLGTKASDPSTDNDGDPLTAGSLYFNSSLGQMRLYTGSAWIPAYVPGTAVNIGFAPYSSIASNNVQGAIQELTDEKLNLSGGTMTGNIVFNAGQTIPGYTPRSSATGAAILPTGTAAQRDVTPAAGYIRFNTDVGQFEGYNGTSWASVGGGATGGGADRVFQENDNTVTTNYTLSTNRNAVSAGPVTVNSGVTVTIPSGSAWVIV